MTLASILRTRLYGSLRNLVTVSMRKTLQSAGLQLCILRIAPMLIQVIHPRAHAPTSSFLRVLDQLYQGVMLRWVAEHTPRNP